MRPRQDAHADAQEAGHEQEVAEEADVGDVRRHPADEQQLDEEDRAAGQEETDVVARQDRDGRCRGQPSGGRPSRRSRGQLEVAAGAAGQPQGLSVDWSVERRAREPHRDSRPGPERGADVTGIRWLALLA